MYIGPRQRTGNVLIDALEDDMECKDTVYRLSYDSKKHGKLEPFCFSKQYKEKRQEIQEKVTKGQINATQARDMFYDSLDDYYRPYMDVEEIRFMCKGMGLARD